MKKICLMTCTGMTSIVGTISRQALYKVVDELRPEQTVLGCLPATNKDVEEDIEFITNYPTIAVEGCNEFCVTNVMNKKDENPMVIFDAENFLMRNEYKFIDKDPGSLDSEDKEMVELLAEKIAKLVDIIIK